MAQPLLPIRADLHAVIPASPTVWVEVCRGKTSFPRRPVLGERFLIGAGSNCHLQLGGQGMPFLHSILTVQGAEITIEAFVNWPELKVNGRPLPSSAVHDNDRIAIGPFEFSVHVEQPQIDSDAEEDLLSPIPLPLAAEAEEDLSRLSALQLVERLEEAELDEERLLQRRHDGASALLDAAWHARPEAAPADERAEVRLLRELNSLADELQERLVQLRERESEQTQRAAAVLAAQERLSEQLRIASENLVEEPAAYRATA